MKPPGQTVAYIRVSASDQNPARQVEALGAGIDRYFSEAISGKDDERPRLQEMLAFVREGDTVVAHSMDRLARNLDNLRAIVRLLTGKGVKVRFVKECLTFTGDDTPIANMLLSVMGAVAEFERSIIRERQKEGIALARTRGVYKGRKPSLNPEQMPEIRKRIQAGEPKARVARDLGISRETLYQYLNAEMPKEVR